ncbi:alpha-galactosidase [Paenibacillus roseipurpureus]|uniref:Alpha-galactosidase n=1 Tax=Paenibacillus roseopurpureus TaxID=2918901 RepID=A0AA96RIM8_9BACL|nr:alpha-galactosidase [Paenibacillus sp. MBLB1832]WNR42980.1 alpha-galactosidase [Paenibacillus sp. MBLB1832]
MQTAAVRGGEEKLAETYRTFILRHFSLNAESRKPYVYYNTWNYQERVRHWQDKPYLSSMNLQRMLLEIEQAHKMGIDVFVIDTGWYSKTGDWQVNRERFPDGLRQVKAKLDEYGMKLGLWFGPTSAAMSSNMLGQNLTNQSSMDGKNRDPHSVWETEESAELCLVSGYADDFADELIRLSQELGVTYFKWDAICQYGCNDPHHHHGDEGALAQEREECYSFLQPLYMVRIIEKLTEACPEAIVDFDVTEGYRCVGLSFLSAGKYFLLNNGPYYANFNIPKDKDITWKNNNMFFYPGAARGWVCRTPLAYDKWIPTVLFLTHYLPDDPVDFQDMAVGSLILGQNGIWGDLLGVSFEGTDRIGKLIGLYKQIRDDITENALRRTGIPGGNPEVYEKISSRSGKGTVVLFANAFGVPFHSPRPASFTYITHCKPDRKVWYTEGVTVRYDTEGYAVITADFEKPGAKIVYFGVKD